MKKKIAPANDDQSWLSVAEIALVTFEGGELWVYTTAGLKIGFLGDELAMSVFATAIVRKSGAVKTARWLRIPSGLRAMPCGIAR